MIRRAASAVGGVRQVGFKATGSAGAAAEAEAPAAAAAVAATAATAVFVGVCSLVSPPSCVSLLVRRRRRGGAAVAGPELVAREGPVDLDRVACVRTVLHLLLLLGPSLIAVTMPALGAMKPLGPGPKAEARPTPTFAWMGQGGACGVAELTAFPPALAEAGLMA